MNATFLMRFKAFMIDYVFILVYLVILFAVNVYLFPSIQELFQGSPILARLVGFLMVTLPVSLYFIISDSAVGGQSFGKKKIGIQVVGAKGKSLSIPRAIFRTALKFLPWELSHFLVYRLVGDGDILFIYKLVGGAIYALMLIYILMAIFTKKGQSLYDIIAKTYVIKVRSNSRVEVEK